MQQLQFEVSWDKGLATQDRCEIEEIFHETKDCNANILCSPIREAINHKQALLITVLIHNFTSRPLTFNNRKIVYSIQGKVIADQTFTLPTLTIPSEVSMPWTFIFSNGNYLPQASLGNGLLEIR